MYVEYHPGGKETVMEGAGQDATALFQESHPWVNIDGLIGVARGGRAFMRLQSVAVGYYRHPPIRAAVPASANCSPGRL